jgi:hypothetical protein
MSSIDPPSEVIRSTDVVSPEELRAIIAWHGAREAALRAYLRDSGAGL